MVGTTTRRFERGTDGLYGLDLGDDERSITLRWMGNTRVLRVPNFGVNALDSGPTEDHLDISTGFADEIEGWIEYGNHRSQTRGANVLRFALAPAFFSERTVRIGMQVGESASITKEIDLRDLARERLARLQLPPRPDGLPVSPDPAMYSRLEVLAPAARALLSVAELDEDVRFSWYERLREFVLDEWRWEARPSAHAWRANLMLGRHMALHRQVLAPHHDALGGNIEYSHHPLGIRFRTDRSLQGLLGTSKAAEHVAGHFDADGVFRTQLSVPLPKSTEYVDAYLQVTGANETTVLVLHLGARELVFPCFQSYNEVGHRIPASWLRGAIDSAGDIALGFSFLSTDGYRRPEDATIGWLNLYLGSVHP